MTWNEFVLQKSQCFKTSRVKWLTDSIWSYIYALLRAKAQAHSGIIGDDTNFDAPKQFQANLEDAINSAVDIPLDIDC